ncbi:MAG TPA: retroviral-like aspartic protease family protein [Candidatus Kapabacteria bacterium]|nr:retroviral-like aspartic protease family protein [Candidatus Kapabacteria bacterium]
MAIERSWHGSLLEDGTPVLSITIFGPHTSKEFNAIIDTGFNGFLSIPQKDADALGIIPQITERVFFADNNSHIRWTSIATITVGSEQRKGVVYLEPASEEVLLGVEFLRRFNRMMLFYPMQNFLQCIETRDAVELINKFRP